MYDAVEAQIQAAIARGDFDNLPGKGKKLDLSADANVPEEHRMTFRILKNANVAPPEVTMMTEAAALRQQIRETDDPAEKKRLAVELASLESVLRLKLERMRR